MTDNHEVDPVRAAQISKRISQAFGFARELVENPDLLNEISDGSSLAFRDATTDKNPSQPARFHSFWQADQAIDALRFLAELIPRAPTDPYLWKWVVFAMHDALQGFMGLALRGSHGAQLLIPEHEQQTYRRWAEERRLGRPIAPSEQRQVDSFLNLYRKIQDPDRMRHFVDSRAFSPTDLQTEAVEALDSYWSELTFYSDTTLTLTVSWFPTMILECLSVIKWLLEESHTVTLFPEEEERAREMTGRVKDAVTPLVDLFVSGDPTR